MNELYFTLLIAGLMLIGAEVFIPGGVLGALGGIMLFIAGLLGYAVFSPGMATLALVGLVVGTGVAIALWIRFFPSTPVGRSMTVANDLKDAHGQNATLSGLVGKCGTTLSALRPSGFAEIEGQRVDVVSQSDMLAAGTPVEVVRVEGNRVVVDLPETEPEPTA